MSGVFLAFGFAVAAWAVHLPSLQRATGISTAMLGTVVLLYGFGALIGMQICGPLSDRWGAGRVALGATLLMTVCVPLPFLTAGLGWVICGALVFGIATGGADVAMNAAAVALERTYERPIMASFHGMFSIGNVIGSGIAAIGFLVHASTVLMTGVMAATGVALMGAASPWLRSPVLTAAAQNLAANHASPGRARQKPGRGRVLVLGAVAFLCLLCEGSAMDWSSLHAQQHLGASPAQGAMAFAAFVSAMTIARFVLDRIVHRVGPVAVVRYGCMLMVVGALLVVTVPTLPVVMVGWALFGLGLAGGAPQVFSTAGNLGGPDSGRVLGRVVGMGYVAFLAGPALVGWIGEATSLNTALFLPVLAGAVCVLAAGSVRREEHGAPR
ncbi:MFS transporter [Mycobacterium sp. AMU20-3851]|uniref:MFS transporter n=1 Tax=Mycobacterium sp. AMU20-3851 TaxID=3122055 RepID=UPI003754EBDB